MGGASSSPQSKENNFLWKTLSGVLKYVGWSSSTENDSEAEQPKEIYALWKTPSEDQKYACCSSSTERSFYAEHEIPAVKTHEKGMQSLPAEIKLIIFSYLTPKEICKSVAPVCKYWYVLSKDPSLWLHLRLRLATWKSTAQIRNRCTLLQTLVIDGLHKETIYDTKVLGPSFPCPHLTELNIRFAKFSDIFLANLPSTSPLIESLTLKSCKYIVPEPAPKICWAYGLPRLRNLKHLQVSSSKCGLTRYNLDVIVKSCLNLQTLVLDTVFVSNQNLQNITLCLKDKLRVLSIAATSVTVEGFAVLASCVHLEEVTFRYTVFLDDTVLDALAHLPLKEFSIFAANLRSVRTVMAVSTEGFVRFFSNPQRVLLKKVVFNGFPNFDDTVIHSVANNCPHLEDLAFPHCVNATDDGLVVLLENNANLKRLNITQTQITRSLIEAFGKEVYTYPKYLQMNIF